MKQRQPTIRPVRAILSEHGVEIVDRDGSWLADESGDEWAWFFRTLAEFRKACDRWERQRAKEAAQAEAP